MMSSVMANNHINVLVKGMALRKLYPGVESESWLVYQDFSSTSLSKLTEDGVNEGDTEVDVADAAGAAAALM